MALDAPQAAERRLRLIEAAMDQASDAVLITDAEPLAADSPRIIYANAQFERLTGYSREEALGRTATMMLGHAETDPAAIATLRRAYLKQRAATVELAIGRRDGTPFFVEMSIAPLDDGGGAITHWIAIQRDVTDRREAQAALLERSRVEAVARLAAGVAHDFNNLLTVIASAAELAELELEPGHAALARIADIRAAAERARAHTGQLLAVSRRDQAEPGVVDVREVVLEAQPVLQRIAGASVRVVLSVPPGAVHCSVDAQELEQALLSLVANARDAQPSGGEVRVLVTGTATRAVIAVEDDGPGLPDDAAGRAFEPFWSTKPLGSGAGLGLPTVRWIAARSGGTARVERAASGGARFVIELPMAQEPGVRTSEAGPAAEVENDGP